MLKLGKDIMEENNKQAESVKTQMRKTIKHLKKQKSGFDQMEMHTKFLGRKT